MQAWMLIGCFFVAALRAKLQKKAGIGGSTHAHEE